MEVVIVKPCCDDSAQFDALHPSILLIFSSFFCSLKIISFTHTHLHKCELNGSQHKVKAYFTQSAHTILYPWRPLYQLQLSQSFCSVKVDVYFLGINVEHFVDILYLL